MPYTADTQEKYITHATKTRDSKRTVITEYKKEPMAKRIDAIQFLSSNTEHNTTKTNVQRMLLQEISQNFQMSRNNSGHDDGDEGCIASVYEG